MEKSNGDLRRFNGGKRKGAGRKARGKARLTIHVNATIARFLREQATASNQSISEGAEILLAKTIQEVMDVIRRRLDRRAGSQRLSEPSAKTESERRHSK